MARRVRGLGSAVARGERVFLRRPTARDEDEYLGLIAVSWPSHRRWFPRLPKGEDPVGPERFRRFLASSRSKRYERLLICRLEDGVLVGSASLSEIVRGCFQNAFLGYWIGSPFEGQGYMTEALGLVVRHALDELKLHRLEANIQPENARSIALIERVGFRREGRARRYLKINGRWRDHDHWVLLAEDR